MKSSASVASKKVTKKATKPAAKKAASKTTARSARSKSKAARPLVIAPDPKSFWTSDGQILNNLRSLAESFAKMDTILYKYHVRTEQNDFADWVEAVLEDRDCAADLRRARSPKTAHTVVVRHLRFYS